MNASPNLDLLRTLAVAFVVFSHLAFTLGAGEASAYHLQALGLFGVAIFFVHTSLVLMMSLGRMPEGPRAVPFLVRRVFRIYPLAIVVVLALYALNSTGARMGGWALVSNLLLIQNLTGAPSTPAPLWSLPFEMQMYLFLPALFLVARERCISCAMTRLAVLWIGAVLLVLAGWRLGLNYHLVKYLPCFLPGIIAYALTRRSGEASFPPIALFGFVAVAGALFPLAVGAGLQETPLLWPLCLALGLLIPACRQLRSEFIARMAKVVATYSYGIYLIHAECIHLAFKYFAPWPMAAKLLIFVMSTALLSWLARHLIEKPGIALGVRLTRKLRDG